MLALWQSGLHASVETHLWPRDGRTGCSRRSSPRWRGGGVDARSRVRTGERVRWSWVAPTRASRGCARTSGVLSSRCETLGASCSAVPNRNGRCAGPTGRVDAGGGGPCGGHRGIQLSPDAWSSGAVPFRRHRASEVEASRPRLLQQHERFVPARGVSARRAHARGRAPDAPSAEAGGGQRPRHQRRARPARTACGSDAEPRCRRRCRSRRRQPRL